MTAGRLGTHALPQMLFLPLFAACLLLLANGCYADERDNSTTERHFDIVVRYSDDERGYRDNDVVLIERGLDEDEVGLDEGLHRQVRQLATSQNEIELLIVLDRRGFARFLNRNNNNDAAARAEVARYFAGVVKSVNERLEQLDAGGFSVRVILTQVLILTGTDSAVTDDLDTNNNGRINSDTALNSFLTLSNSLDATSPHDYSLLVTGYDLRRPNGVNPVGITFQNGVCSSNKQGIMEEEGDEMISVTMAHEVGHTLGARHDQQQNSCPDLFFTMAAASGVPFLRSQSFNPFTFSECSKTEIRSFLSTQFTDCLRSRQTTPGSEVDIAALTTVPLGQQYTADQQCRNAYGPTSRFCREQYSNPNFVFDGDMCYDMRCGLPQGGCARTLPFNGTTCGDRKWCEEGSCVTNQEAPAAPSATCPQGDDPTVNCSPSSCAIEQLRLFQCCATCAPGPPPTTPGDVTMSVHGVTPGPGPGPMTMSVDGVQPGTTPGPGPPSSMSIFGVQPQTGTPAPGGPTMSIDGVQPQTGTPPPGGSTMSIYGVQPQTGTPPPGGSTMSIYGVQPQTGTPPPGGPTMSIYGVQPQTGTPTPGGPTMSIYGVQPGPTPGPVGPTLSVDGVGPGPVGPTLSVDVAGPVTAPSVGPTLSSAGLTQPTTAGISVAPGQPATPPPPTVSVP